MLTFMHRNFGTFFVPCHNVSRAMCSCILKSSTKFFDDGVKLKIWFRQDQSTIYRHEILTSNLFKAQSFVSQGWGFRLPCRIMNVSSTAMDCLNYALISCFLFKLVSFKISRHQIILLYFHALYSVVSWVVASSRVWLRPLRNRIKLVLLINNNF